MESLNSLTIVAPVTNLLPGLSMQFSGYGVLRPCQQAWRPQGDEVNQDAGHETLAEQLAMEALACPQGSAAKPYVAALCKVRCSARVHCR